MTETTILDDVTGMGDTLVKVEDSPAIFYIDAYAHRYQFPTQAEYESWYGNNFDRVRIVSESVINDFPLAGQRGYQPGTLLRFSGDMNVYEVVTDWDLKSSAVDVGTIYDVPVEEFSNFTVLY
jgi:hypothetical protein